MKDYSRPQSKRLLCAPFRRQVKPIGAKWLRNGVDENQRFPVPENSQETNNVVDSNLDPHSTPQNMRVDNNYENQGRRDIQIIDQGVSQGKYYQQESSKSVKTTYKKDIIGIESKKRRIENGPDSNNTVGFSTEVQMVADEEDNVEENNDISKNGPEASIHGDARLLQ